MSDGGHITVKELTELLAKLPADARVGPSVGTWSLTLWDAQDEEMIGTIRNGGDQGYDFELFGDGDNEGTTP